MSQIVEIVSEYSPTKNLGEYSDTQALHAHFCPNFQPIYHLALSFKVAVSLTEDEALALAAELLSVVASRRGFQPESSDEEPE